MKIIIFGLCILMSSFNIHATMNVYDFKDSQKEQRFEALIKELRCPKCQNNNLADSNAPLATDIKKYVYKSVIDGKKDREIKDFLISRYGEFVTYKPEFAGLGILIWTLPFLLILTAIGWVYIVLKKKKENVESDLELISMKDIIRDYEEKDSKGKK